MFLKFDFFYFSVLSFNKSQTNAPIESSSGRASTDSRPFPFPLLNADKSKSSMQRKQDKSIPSNHRIERIYPSYSSASSSTKLTGNSSKLLKYTVILDNDCFLLLQKKHRTASFRDKQLMPSYHQKIGSMVLTTILRNQLPMVHFFPNFD